MKKFYAMLLAAAAALLLASCAESGSAPAPETPETPATASVSPEGASVLVVYFSATGTTEAVAGTLAEAAGADLAEIIPAEPYTEEDLNYHDSSCRANREQNDGSARPEISGSIENWDSYDIVLIGHPIWWGMEPRIMDTFMESYDFSGKTLVNFCTSGGSGIAAASAALQALAPEAAWLEGRRFGADLTVETARSWLSELGIGAPE